MVGIFKKKCRRDKNFVKGGEAILKSPVDASLLGIRHVVLAINKIDLVDFSEQRFEEIHAEFETFAKGFDFDTLTAIPMSARYGDNVTIRSKNMNWYVGFTDAGLIRLVSFISPFRLERDMTRDPLEDGKFIEVFVDTSIEECKNRDPKCLYAKADHGEIKDFTGIGSLYEAL